MPRSQKVSEKARLTKQSLFETAMRLFKEQGFYRTTIEEIAAAANASVGTFYYHFKCKEDVLFIWADSLDDNYEKFYQQLKAARGDKNALQLLHELLIYTLDICSSWGHELNPAIYLYMIQNPQLYMRMTNHRRVYAQILGELITEGQSSGVIRVDLTAEQIAGNIHRLNRGALIDWSIGGGKEDITEVSASLVEMFIQGMRPPALLAQPRQD